MALQHLRSSTAHKRPIPTVMSAGQIAINTNEASPALFFKDSNGDLVKVGPVHVGENAPNSSPASTAATALVTGTVYQILTVGTTDFTLVGASANTVGTIFTATGTTTGTGTVSGQQGVEKGEMWLDTTGGTYVLKIYDGSAWRSESGTFVDVNGDTMTGALLLDNAASSSAPDLSFDGDADTGIYSPGANQVAVATSGTGRLFVDASGNVGVGTSTPTTKLDIFTDSATGTYVKVENTAGRLFAGVFADGRGYLSTETLDPLTFATDGTERMRIDSSGRLGVGTTSPGDYSGAATKFTVAASGNSGLNIVSGTANSGIIRFADGTSGDAAYRGRIEYMHDVDALMLGTAGSERMRIASDGSVGIGTSSPAKPVHIANGLPIIRLEDTTTNAFSEIQSDNAGNLYLRADHGNSEASSSIRLDVDGSEKLRIDSAGNVGIGTDNPAELLHVKGATNTTLRIDNTDDSTATIMFANTGSTNMSIAVTDTNMIFGDTNNERMRIDSSGRLLVGTTSGVGKFIVQDSSLPKIQANFNGTKHLEMGVGGSGCGFAMTTGHFMTFNHQPYADRGTDNNLTERMRISNNGQKQHHYDSSANPKEIFNWSNNTTGMSFRSAAVQRGSIYFLDSGVSYNTTSDYRAKENIVDLTDAISRLKQLYPRRFNFIVAPEKTVDGFIAHEAQAVVPEAVTGTKDEVDDEGNAVMQGIDQSKLVPLLTAALQEAIAKIETLEQRLSDAGIA